MLVIVGVLVLMAVLPALQVHIKVEGVDPALFRPAKMEMVAVHLHAVQSLYQPVFICSQIQQRHLQPCSV